MGADEEPFQGDFIAALPGQGQSIDGATDYFPCAPAKK
jgi:hypothetical protein